MTVQVGMRELKMEAARNVVWSPFFLQIHLLHVVPVPLPEIVGGLGGLDTGLVSVDPDPKEDIMHVRCFDPAARPSRSSSPLHSSHDLLVHLQIAEAKEFIKRRFVTKLATRNIAYKVEIVHFLTDNDSIGEAICTRADALKAATVVLAKHQRGAVAEFFMGSVTKVRTNSGIAWRWCNTVSIRFQMKAPLAVGCRARGIFAGDGYVVYQRTTFIVHVQYVTHHVKQPVVVLH